MRCRECNATQDWWLDEPEWNEEGFCSAECGVEFDLHVYDIHDDREDAHW